MSEQSQAQRMPDGKGVLPAEIEAWLTAQRHDPARRQQAVELLTQMIRIDTTPKASPRACAAAEGLVFDIIEGHLTACSPDLQTERVDITEQIADHPYFTLPYYAGPLEGKPARIVRRVYRDRCNLMIRLPNPGQPVLALNAHVDTVAPHLPPRVEGDIIHGRGAVDDKGPCLVMMLAMQLLAEARTRFGLRPACEVLLQFVIDEETGGNGSLSAALDKPRSAFDAIVVLECTDLQIHPGNRGVVWYETILQTTESVDGRDTLLEAMAFVVDALGACGRQLKAESDHPLFPHRPVQTCHGILGTHGKHPSRVQDHVPLRLTWQGDLLPELRVLVDDALADYCRQYGDKTRPGAGDAVLERHLAWSEEQDKSATLEVFGLAGHMGSVDRLDGAITKAAAIIRRLVAARRERGGDWATMTMTLADRGQPNGLTMEGGQGFLPTHTLEQVAQRMRQAVAEGVRAYAESAGLPAKAITSEIRFDKLHNDAFARPSDGPAMRTLLAAAAQAGHDQGEPLRGWDVSCDARIFAREFPDAEVITFGPGPLSQAHANDERVDLNHLLQAAETLARMAWSYQ
ncbi:MAG: M20/M25/M40 family metallo-hydrolase [Phycisphaerae bacterium]|nr:M20/M25/M40 family metallo-hydrolase [Phycisphaerae bacterium]